MIVAGPSAPSAGRPTALLLGAKHGGAMGRLARARSLAEQFRLEQCLCEHQEAITFLGLSAINFKNHGHNFIWSLVMCEDATLV